MQLRRITTTTGSSKKQYLRNRGVPIRNPSDLSGPFRHPVQDYNLIEVFDSFRKLNTVEFGLLCKLCVSPSGLFLKLLYIGSSDTQPVEILLNWKSKRSDHLALYLFGVVS